jgi:hypothetical protein
MKPEIKQKWCSALRSGEYQQGTGVLHRKSDNTFCCLGVLCDLYLKEIGSEWQIVENAAYTIDGESWYLPDSVIKWAGLDELLNSKHPLKLGDKNDAGDSFERIANLIEEQL